MPHKTVTVLGINGHIGHAVAKAFLARGWRVIGFGRANRHPIAGVEFIKGDAELAADMARATAPASVVFNGLNLAYDKWGNGAAEALMARVIAASEQKTLLFPGNIYNYRATDRVITPDLRQDAETERGAIRVRMETLFAQAVTAGKLRAILVRAGNFYGSPLGGDFFDALILREAKKGKVALNPARTVKNAWAYVPDLAEVFAILAERRETLEPFARFHFAGHLEDADATFAAIEKAVPHIPLRRVGYPWAMLTAMGILMPVIKGLVEMRYIWENELGLADERLDVLLGPDFGTDFTAAIANSVRPYFADRTGAAA